MGCANCIQVSFFFSLPEQVSGIAAIAAKQLRVLQRRSTLPYEESTFSENISYQEALRFLEELSQEPENFSTCGEVCGITWTAIQKGILGSEFVDFLHPFWYELLLSEGKVTPEKVLIRTPNTACSVYDVEEVARMYGLLVDNNVADDCTLIQFINMLDVASMYGKLSFDDIIHLLSSPALAIAANAVNVEEVIGAIQLLSTDGAMSKGEIGNKVTELLSQLQVSRYNDVLTSEGLVAVLQRSNADVVALHTPEERNQCISEVFEKSRITAGWLIIKLEEFTKLVNALDRDVMVGNYQGIGLGRHILVLFEQGGYPLTMQINELSLTEKEVGSPMYWPARKFYDLTSLQHTCPFTWNVEKGV